MPLTQSDGPIWGRIRKKERSDNRIRYLIGPCFSLLLFGVLVLFLSGHYPIVKFTDERIDIQIHPNHIIVEGNYFYKNPYPFPVIQGFSIPVPVDEKHSLPVMLSVKKVSPGGKIPVITRYILGKHRFETTFRAGEKIGIKIYYQQQVQEKSASYTLLTTKPWGWPLVHGIYNVIPKGIKLLSSNYVLQAHQSGIYNFQRQYFMPEKDWLFTWEVI